jgi:hypothetical protein
LSRLGGAAAAGRRRHFFFAEVLPVETVRAAILALFRPIKINAALGTFEEFFAAVVR